MPALAPPLAAARRAARPPEPRAAAAAVAWARRERARIVGELCELVRFPSISADPRCAPEVRRCARWLAAQLARVGMRDVRVEPTARHPIVWARRPAPPGRPTVLIYGHYDVQPVEPLTAWRSPPFAPVVRGGALYGRGASDDKGQLFAHVKALEALLRTSGGQLPVGVVCAFEGGEEIGSPGFEDFVARHEPELRCDAVVVSDTTMLGPRRPALIYGLRGSLSLELTLATGRRSLHSGTYGGAVLGAPQALAQLLARLYGDGGAPVLPGLADGVRPAGAGERARLARAGPTDAQLARTAGAPLIRDPPFSAFERTTLRPALVVTSVWSGYQGPGFQATIPLRARARLNVRLVPDQRPADVERRLREHLRRLAPAGTRCEVRRVGAQPPVLLPVDHPAMAAAARAYRAGFGAAPALVRSGGTIAVVEILHRRLGVPVVLMGFGLRDDRHHAPNERFRLTSLFGGIATAIHFLCELGAAGSPGVVGGSAGSRGLSRSRPRRAPG